EQVAIDYFAKLKANGVNVLTVFVESLDLSSTPIFLEPSPGQSNPTVLKFLDRLIDLAKNNDVYLLLRLYDTFYYKDNGYPKNLERKWADTYWYKQYHKSSPEGFFDADLYESHKNRMKILLERYRNEPHILGWDLVNEIDNKVRFNEAGGYQARKRWVEEMVRFAKIIDPNHLVFYSFLTWDPKDANYYRASIGERIPTLGGDVMDTKRYIGMDAAFAYRLPGVELAMPHGYYAHVANPWSPHIPDYAPPLEIARGITYGFYQIRDGRPILDGESSPNGHLYERIYGQDGFTEGQDDKDFMNGAWLHFAAGGAGANLRWPADLRPSNFRNTVNQITDVKRAFLKTFKENVGDILWQGDRLQVSTRKLGDDLVQITRHDEKSAVVYLYNQTGIPIQEVTLSDLPKAEAGEIKVINPAQPANNVLFNQSKVPVGAGRPAIRLDRPTDNAAVIVRNMVLEKATPIPPTPSNSDGIIADRVWIKATIKIPGIPDSEALWQFGGDEMKNGNRAVWGYFYANPNVFDWGDENNPEVFVKVWFDPSGRIDVNFFHVSGPDIEVLSSLKEIITGQTNTVTQAKRYARHTYGQGNPTSELLETPEVSFGKADANPRHNPVPVQDSQIGAVIQTEDKGAIDAAWHFGGASTTKRGDQVAWGFFYANPSDVSWGFENNPDVYVKVWYDVADKRVDVNFFHVSVPNIRVYSGFSNGNYDDGSQVTKEERYTRHVYQK
ncbi:MAG: hypothetical protein BWK78_06490, partial [Thiotrichaceae bacterium IS1]